MKSKTEFWFPAKRFGWGWGPPIRWQGWLVLGAYIGAAILVAIYLSPAKTPLAFLASIFLLSALLIWICRLKGEPPKWRWNEPGDPKP